MNFFQLTFNKLGTKVLRLSWSPRGVEESGTEEIFEEIMPENFLKLTKDIKPHIQEVLILQEHHNKSAENQNNKKTLEVEKKGTSDISMEIMEVRRQQIIFKVVKENSNLEFYTQ